jgi:hypothetical protein
MNAAPELPDRDSHKAGGHTVRRAAPGRRGGRGGDLAHDLGERLARAAQHAGYEWWWTTAATGLGGECAGVPLVEALDGLAGALRAGHDPDVVVGGDGAELAVEVAGEWLAAGIGPRDIAGWVQTGCWRPAAARGMADAGVRPAQLLRGDGSPRHVVDSVSGWPVPLARAVADDEMSVAAAVAHLRGLADTYRVRVERVGRAWRLDVEGVGAGAGKSPNLGEIDRVVRALIAEHRAGDPEGAFVTIDVDLPAPIRARIDRAAQLRDEGEHPASDPAARRLARDAAAAELQAAARDLARLGVTVADVAELLQVTTRTAHDLLREPRP